MDQRSYRTIEANGIRFAYIEAGRGPLVICVHGFPDTPHTFEHLLERLASEGYHVVAPWSRGIHPTSAPADGDYSPLQLGRDDLALIAAFGHTSGTIIGHDWGALGAYAAANLDPARVSKLVTIAIPHPRAIHMSPRLMRRAWHFAFFLMPFAARMARRHDYALLRHFWSAWSPHMQPDERLVELFKDAYSDQRSLNAALAYYRALPWVVAGVTRRQRKARAVLYRKTSVPTLCFAGTEDGVFHETVFDWTHEAFTGPYHLVKMRGAGHFLHLECAGEFLDRVSDFINARDGFGPPLLETGPTRV